MLNQSPAPVHRSAPKVPRLNPNGSAKPYFSDSLKSMIFITVISNSESDLPSAKHTVCLSIRVSLFLFEALAGLPSASRSI